MSACVWVCACVCECTRGHGRVGGSARARCGASLRARDLSACTRVLPKCALAGAGGRVRPLPSPVRPSLPPRGAGCLRISTSLTPSSRTFSGSPSLSARTAGLHALLAGHLGNHHRPVCTRRPPVLGHLLEALRQVQGAVSGGEGEGVCVSLRVPMGVFSSLEAAISGSS